MRKLIIIADWGWDSLSCAEVKTAVLGFLEKDAIPDISFIASNPSTVHTAFLIEQMFFTVSRLGIPEETVIFQNTDPRINNNLFSSNPWNGKLLLLKLKNGLWVFGPNAGYDFSLIKKEIAQVFYYPNFEKGGQFRSRDLYARLAAHFIEEKEDELDLEEISLDAIPPLTGYYVAHIDNFGNIKTTIKKSDLKGKVEYREKLKVKINNTVQEVTYTEGLFKYQPNQLIIYPGSSGSIDDPYLEISVWRYFDDENKNKTGSFYFKFPSCGDKIVLLFNN